MADYASGPQQAADSPPTVTAAWVMVSECSRMRVPRPDRIKDDFHCFPMAVIRHRDWAASLLLLHNPLPPARSARRPARRERQTDAARARHRSIRGCRPLVLRSRGNPEFGTRGGLLPPPVERNNTRAFAEPRIAGRCKTCGTADWSSHLREIVRPRLHLLSQRLYAHEPRVFGKRVVLGVFSYRCG